MLLVIHPLNVAMIGAVTSVLCLIHASFLLVRQLSSSSAALAWTSEATSAGFVAAAILWITSHLLVLFERRLAWSRPQLVTRSTAVLGVCAVWIYSLLVACVPVLRAVLVDVEPELAGFRRGYVVYLVAQFIFVAVASGLVMLSVVDALRRGGGHSSGVARRFQAGGSLERDRTWRCVAALVVTAALWTPCITLQLVDQLSCRPAGERLDRREILDVLIRQVSPLVGLSAGLLLPVIYRCRCPSRPGCCTRATTAFYIS